MCAPTVWVIESDYGLELNADLLFVVSALLEPSFATVSDTRAALFDMIYGTVYDIVT